MVEGWAIQRAARVRLSATRLGAVLCCLAFWSAAGWAVMR